MKRCPICAEMVDDHLSVCPYCGEALPGGEPTPSAPENTATGATRFCPVCGESIGAHLSICPVCFEPTNFDTAPAEQTSPVETPVERPVETPVERPVETPIEQPIETPRKPEPTTHFEPQSEPETHFEPQSEPETRFEPKPETRYQPASEPESQWTPPPTPESTMPSRSGNPLKWLLIILCSLLVIGLGVLAFLLLKGDKEGGEPSIDLPREAVNRQGIAPAENLIQQRLDSVAQSLPEEAFSIHRYDDAERQCIFYVSDGELMVYRAKNDATESISIPVMSGSGTVLDMYAEDKDKEFLILEVEDEENSRTLYYKMNTITESFEQVGEEGAPSGAQSYTEPSQADEKPPLPNNRDGRPKGSWTDEGNYDTPPPPPPSNARENSGRPQRVFRNHDDQRSQERMQRESHRQDDYPPPPPSSGTGFHLEPANPGQGGSNSGSGIRLEKVDRIPNQ